MDYQKKRRRKTETKQAKDENKIGLIIITQISYTYLSMTFGDLYMPT